MMCSKRKSKAILKSELPFFIIIFVVLLLFGMAKWACSQEDGLEDESWVEEELVDESWTVEERMGKVFYFTHSPVVWGHEFGFFKDPNDCDADTLWLTLSCIEEKVKDFIGKDVMVLLTVDAQDFKIKTSLLYAAGMGITYLMTFTNARAEKQLIDALAKGQYVKVKILEPKELEVLLDFKEDQFSLAGFMESREKAKIACNAIAP